MRKIIRNFAAVAMFGASLASFGDYGEAFVVIRCNEGSETLEVQPLILWNEQYDEIASDLENTQGRVARADGTFVSANTKKPFEEACTINGKIISIRYYLTDSRPVLELLDGNESIVKVTIEDVWVFWGYEFRVRYTSPAGWQEICGREEDSKDWKTLEKARTSTNCRVTK